MRTSSVIMFIKRKINIIITVTGNKLTEEKRESDYNMSIYIQTNNFQCLKDKCRVYTIVLLKMANRKNKEKGK